ncbi:MAG: synthase subunit [Sporomusa sp.]|jgi:F0F1-type ATP synthase assembly protein I|nr:synthase subunit [Sporomusa sp.]
MDNKDTGFLKNLSLLTYIGLTMTIPIAAGVVLGSFLDRRLLTGNVFLMISTVIGVGASFLNVYRVVMKSMNKK